MNLLFLSAITFTPGNFVDYLKYMGLGMLVIFLIIGLIIAVTMIINALCSSKKKSDEAQTENER